MRILVSACLLGLCCRYDGGGKANGAVLALGRTQELIPVCPEQLGGLPTPRPPAEISGGRVRTADGTDVTEAYRRGGEETVKLAKLLGCTHAILKARSPSCGSGERYDGTFSGRTVPGNGVTAAALMEQGITLWNETNFPSVFPEQ